MAGMAVVSTSTIALQKALTEEYIPQISGILLEHHVIDRPLSFVVRKGKKHYICDSRLGIYEAARVEKALPGADGQAGDIPKWQPFYLLDRKRGERQTCPVCGSDGADIISGYLEQTNTGHYHIRHYVCQGDFNHFKKMLGIYSATVSRIMETSKPSPFDFQNNGLLYIPERMPFPVPNPVMKYQRTQYEDFDSYRRNIIIPEMLIKLRQWFGRGIRSDLG